MQPNETDFDQDIDNDAESEVKYPLTEDECEHEQRIGHNDHDWWCPQCGKIGKEWY